MSNSSNHADAKLSELREELRSRGLKAGGSKAELVARLRDDDATKSAKQEATLTAAPKRAPSEGSDHEPATKRRKINGASDGVRAIIMDIEGTTTPISFVHDKLFPYARERLASFVANNWETKGIQEIYELAQSEVKDADAPAEKTRDWLTSYMEAAMSKNLKVTSLKKLQGLMWKDGYDSGHLKGEVFDDVPRALKRWTEHTKLYIYSSGSVPAQKMLFGQSIAGDLTIHLNGYFDTTTGPKVEAASYNKIAAEIALPASSLLFLTDISKEADAASDAGLRTAILSRPGNGPLSKESREAHAVIESFDEVDGML